jgi:hypothetical protein
MTDILTSGQLLLSFAWLMVAGLPWPPIDLSP